VTSPPNLLYYGDNLDVLVGHVKDDSIDLVYLDPPFNSNRSYNVIFAQHNVYESDDAAQIKAFDDTWHWTPETDTQYKTAISGGVPAKVADALTAMRTLLGENDAMAYLVNMAPRLVELHRGLKPTGSLYLHCDPTMSHYLKMMLDAVFGPANFHSEIVWRRSNAHNKLATQYGPIHDTILFYSKTPDFKFHPGTRPYTKAYIEDRFKSYDSRGRYQTNYLTGPGTRQGQSGAPWRGFDPTKAGRHWAVPASLREFLPERGAGMTTEGQLEALLAQELIVFPKKVGGQPMYKQYVGPGVPYQDIWAYQPNTRGVLFESDEHIDQDVKWLEAEEEKLGFDTQKPAGLLKRIIETSSDDGDVVLDPFCGCGTTIAAAQALGRHWIGIDITYLAVDLIEKRLLHAFGPTVTDGYEVHGIPRDLLGAQALFNDAPLDFERWAVSLVNGTPNEKQVGDRGMDGVVRFFTDSKGATGRALVSVKGGKMLNPAFVRDLLGTVQTQNAEMGLLITITKPTPGMRDAADHAGTYTWPVNSQKFPKIQLVTVEELLAGKVPPLPPTLTPYIKAQRFQAPADQMTLDQ
jgi:DNA modification methylase